MARKCGECLMNDIEVVELKPNGKCPRCGADYGPDTTDKQGKPLPKPQGVVKRD